MTTRMMRNPIKMKQKILARMMKKKVLFSIMIFMNFGYLGEVNDPADELEKKRNEALKRIQVVLSWIFRKVNCS